MRRALLLLPLLMACGSGPGDPGGAGCDFETVDGTFLVHHQKTSGDCSDIPDVVVTTLVGDSGCTTIKDAPSENGCRHDVDLTCPLTGGGTIEATGYIRQRDSSADHFDSLVTYHVVGTGVNCTSTYDVTYTRQ
jgi:hypothetical protein